MCHYVNISPLAHYPMSAHLGAPLRQPPGRLLANASVCPRHNGYAPSQVNLVTAQQSLIDI